MAPFNNKIKTYQKQPKDRKSSDVLNDLIAQNLTKRLIRKKRGKLKMKELPARMAVYVSNDSINVTTENTFDKVLRGRVYNKVKVVENYIKINSSESDASKSQAPQISVSYHSPIMTRTRLKQSGAVISEITTYSLKNTSKRRNKSSTLDKPVDVSLSIEKDNRKINFSSLSYIQLPKIIEDKVVSNEQCLNSASMEDASYQQLFSDTLREKQVVHSSTPCIVVPAKKFATDTISPIYQSASPKSSKLIKKSYDEIKKWDSSFPVMDEESGRRGPVLRSSAAAKGAPIRVRRRKSANVQQLKDYQDWKLNNLPRVYLKSSDIIDFKKIDHKLKSEPKVYVGCDAVNDFRGFTEGEQSTNTDNHDDRNEENIVKRLKRNKYITTRSRGVLRDAQENATKNEEIEETKPEEKSYQQNSTENEEMEEVKPEEKSDQQGSTDNEDIEEMKPEEKSDQQDSTENEEMEETKPGEKSDQQDLTKNEETEEIKSEEKSNQQDSTENEETEEIKSEEKSNQQNSTENEEIEEMKREEKSNRQIPTKNKVMKQIKFINTRSRGVLRDEQENATKNEEIEETRSEEESNQQNSTESEEIEKIIPEEKSRQVVTDDPLVQKSQVGTKRRKCESPFENFVALRRRVVCFRNKIKKKTRRRIPKQSVRRSAEELPSDNRVSCSTDPDSLKSESVSSVSSKSITTNISFKHSVVSYSCEDLNRDLEINLPNRSEEFSNETSTEAQLVTSTTKNLSVDEKAFDTFMKNYYDEKDVEESNQKSVILIDSSTTSSEECNVSTELSQSSGSEKKVTVSSRDNVSQSKKSPTPSPAAPSDKARANKRKRTTKLSPVRSPRRRLSSSGGKTTKTPARKSKIIVLSDISLGPISYSTPTNNPVKTYLNVLHDHSYSNPSVPKYVHKSSPTTKNIKDHSVSASDISDIIQSSISSSSPKRLNDKPTADKIVSPRRRLFTEEDEPSSLPRTSITSHKSSDGNKVAIPRKTFYTIEDVQSLLSKKSTTIDKPKNEKVITIRNTELYATLQGKGILNSKSDVTRKTFLTSDDLKPSSPRNVNDKPKKRKVITLRSSELYSKLLQENVANKSKTSRVIFAKETVASSPSLQPTSGKPKTEKVITINEIVTATPLREKSVIAGGKAFSTTLYPPVTSPRKSITSDPSDEEKVVTVKKELSPIEETTPSSQRESVVDFKSPAEMVLTPRKKAKSITLKPGKSYRRKLSMLRRSSIVENVMSTSTCHEDCTCMNCILREKLNQSSVRRTSIIVPVREDEATQSILEVYARRSSCYVQEQQGVDLDESFGNLSLKTRVEDDSFPIVTAKEIVLRKCGQSEVLPFEKCYPGSLLQHCQKIGEGVYGEVFLYRNQNGDTSVMKIIPIEGDIIVNGEKQKKFEEIVTEIIIATELSNLRLNETNTTTSFSQVKHVKCVQGCYPDQLIDLWELYHENFGSENDSPQIFPPDQLYVVIELANGGKDLESYTFNSALQAYAMFKQTACALAVAETQLKFEHRDLHWGNVLITKVDNDKTLQFKINGKNIDVNTNGVEVAIIDFTLSRIEFNGVIIFNDLSQDNDLFSAKGDYQFDIYRLMQKQNGNEWRHYEPYSNILWLHYILEKAITSSLRYKNTRGKIHRDYMAKLRELHENILSHPSAMDFVLHTF